LKQAKCDFCEKESIGYCFYQCAIYCADHQEEAENIEKEMFKEQDNTFEQMENN
jgi:hypothetical protein